MLRFFYIELPYSHIFTLYRTICMKQRLFITVTVLALISSVASAQMVPLNVIPRIIPQLVTIRKQDIESGDRLEQEKKKMRDYQNRREGREQITKKLLKKREQLIERTNIPEYKIKSGYVKKIKVSANAILTPEEISNIVKDYENTDLNATEIKELMGRIDELCVDKGCITSFAYLSQQDSKNVLLKIAIKEGKVGKINIKGNRWTKVSHINSRLDIIEGENFNTNDVLFSGGAGLRVQLPFNIVLKATYGVPLKHNKFDKHHGN